MENNLIEYEKLSDEEVVSLAQNGDEKAVSFIFEKYSSYVRRIARPFFLLGGDAEDVAQEGMIGLFKAITSFNNKSGFKSYVFTCVKNRIISAIRKSNSNKNLPLNAYISLTGYTDNDLDKSSIFIGESEDPETLFINLERSKEFKERIDGVLSKYENTIMTLYLQGYSYSEIAEKLGKNSKSIDNAMQRIRKKIETCLH